MRKWRGQFRLTEVAGTQVTVSPGFIAPLVTPAIARSPDPAMESVCASTDSDKSKQSVAGAVIAVSSRMRRTSGIRSTM
jgi:hypothetical protein